MFVAIELEESPPEPTPGLLWRGASKAGWDYPLNSYTRVHEFVIT
jgi:hypothetical protein